MVQLLLHYHFTKNLKMNKSSIYVTADRESKELSVDLE